MTTYNIAVIPGDGVGIEVVTEGIKTLTTLETQYDTRFNITEFPWGSGYYMKHGKMMPNNALDQLQAFDAIYFGAVGHPDVQDHITLNGLLLPMRRSFDQYICLRPSVLYEGIESPLRGKKPGAIDMIVVRENTEGEYSDIGGFQYQSTPQEVAIQTSVFTRTGCERTIRYAFNLARQRKRKMRLCSVTKSNAQGYSMVLWDRTFDQVGQDYPDVETESLLIDAACMNFIRRPESFDVVVASNLFGDILTDIGAIITGSMGLAPSANINPEKRFPSVFEPVHGSAPDIAGQGIVNPIAAILSVGLMLDHLGEESPATRVRAAALSVLSKGEVKTPDLGGTSTTAEVGDAVVKSLVSV